MQVLIAGDHDEAVVQIRQVLHREGLDCPASHVVALSHTAERLAQVNPELVVLTLLPDPERALAVLEAVRGKVLGRVLAVGPIADSKLVLRALRSGADDYVDQLDLVAELEIALARQRAELAAQLTTAGRIIAVFAPSGGSG